MSNRYTYRAEWSPEDGEFVGLVAEFPSLSWLAESPSEAVAGAERLVDDILADMAETGEKPPVPLTERRYSGNLSVRTSPAQHRALAIEAAEQRVSVNQWINHKLATPVRPSEPVRADQQKPVDVEGGAADALNAGISAATFEMIRNSPGYQSAVQAAAQANVAALQYVTETVLKQGFGVVPPSLTGDPEHVKPTG